MIKTPTPHTKPGKPGNAEETGGSDRIAKVIARAGLCSRRDAESWIAEGRVRLNGKVLASPAVTVKADDVVEVDGQPLPRRERTRMWLFHKPKGTVTTTYDPEGRKTVFEVLPADLPRVMTIGRLDINTEGLLLLTNDGGVARVLELPTTGWLRRYRVRAHGDIDQARLDALRDGVAIDGILYGAVEASLDRKQGDNVWLSVGLREGKNREVKTILGYLGLEVNRLIRVSFGPFQLGELEVGAIEEVPRRVLRDQLGERLALQAGADFELREGDRAPIQQTLAKAAAAKAADKPARAPEKARSRPPRASRYDADAPEARIPRRGSARADAETAAARTDERLPRRPGAGRPDRPFARDERRSSMHDAPHPAQKPRRERLELGAPAEAAPRHGRLSRSAVSGEDAPRAYRSGKSFDVDRKPREGKEPARVRGDKPPREAPPPGSGRTAHAKGAPRGTGKPGAGPSSGKPDHRPPKSGGPGKTRGRDADRRR